MRKLLLLAVLLGTCSLLPATASATPPSFAKWATAWSAKVDKSTDKIANACLAQFGEDDAKVGPCFVKGMRPSLRALAPQWERGVTAALVGQKAACRTAIRSYAAASRRQQASNLAYLDGHQQAAMTRVLADLQAPPHTTIRAASAKAKATAIKICG
jgi:hypothetical protein